MGEIKHHLLSYLTKSPSFLDMKGQRFLWLVRLRFIALFIQLPLTLVGRHYGYLNFSSHLIFSFIFIALIIYNATLYKKITKDKNTKIGNSFLAFQVSLDLVVFSYLLHLTGGANNPLYAFFYVIAVFGGIFTTGLGSTVFFLILFMSVLMIQISPSLTTDFALAVIFNQQTFPYLLAQLLIPSVIFFVARSFGGLLDKSQKDLVSLTVHAERLDRLRAVGALSAGFSHEFASPLHSAQIRLKRLARNFPEENQDLQECALALDDCEKILKQMNSSQLQLSMTDFELIDFDQVLVELTESWKLDYPEIEIQKNLIQAKVKIPRINFAQALFNLLDNSAEAMNFKGVIRLETTLTDSEVLLAIQDEGHGFDSDVLLRIGEPFNTNKSTGTGLGLYSTILFMESVAGKMEVSNRKPRGSNIELHFPRVLS